MRAMILAAGLGTRMGELTTNTPKPLLKLGNALLIEHVIFNLKKASITDIVINVFYHAAEIKAALGDGTHYGVNIIYSEETERLETGGGIIKALPLLGTQPFIVVSSDVICDFPLTTLKTPKAMAHLVLVNNPRSNPTGDFGLQDDFLTLHAPKFTYANIGIYRAEFFRGKEPEFLPLKDLLFPAVAKRQITGEHYQGQWYNIGTPEELALAETRVSDVPTPA